jgi:hypothetical protein
MTEKILGYFLLIVGIMIIFFTAINVYNVFNKKTKPIDILNLPGISLDLSSLAGGQLPTGAAKPELIAPEVLNQPMNLALHLFFMGFISTIGFKIASLGVMLVRPIKIKLRTQEDKPKQASS